MQDIEYTNEQKFNFTSLSTNNSELQGDLFQLIHYFDKINIKEIDPMVIFSKQENFTIEDFNIIVDKINDFITELNIKGIERESEKQIIEYFSNHNINSQEFYNWLLNNQNSSNSIFILGYFNCYGIITNRNKEKAFNLFINDLGTNHILAQHYIGHCYLYGIGTMKNDKLAFEYYEKVAIKNLAYGQLNLGCCYKKGIGIKKDFKKAFYLYEKAADKGNVIAIYNLGNCYVVGAGVNKDYNKALELYQNAANLGHNKAQYCLALMYEKGNGIAKDIDKAIYWYEKSAKQGNELAKNNLNNLQKKSIIYGNY
ncbi:uncharacterized protein OCT59_024208 [Rhizophagus irregularis]|uniref:Skt5p n=1 Tax=Rhizophagus irregularis (strain DAOM 197198w) TaxID=1432141 RepID=A0A015IEF3_RHIIW|nr:Skt5p [Rhizophagus irregularis DAOM 197198w]UZO03806.1 hypothetical protein OCT59_024208 [Rhizophagus irregularis]GET58626.1 kinase-like domain-containing protein [Rhizophagus irregularis DAOM 181602=DAOM 197198]